MNKLFKILIPLEIIRYANRYLDVETAGQQPLKNMSKLSQLLNTTKVIQKASKSFTK